MDENNFIVRTATPQGWGPGDLQDAYKLPSTGGNGKIIAAEMFTHYPNAEADLAVYRKAYGLPPCTKANGCFMQVDQNGGTSSFPDSSSCDQAAGENALDIQMLSAACPDCKILLVEVNGSDDKAIKTAIKLGAVAVSFSWGTQADLNDEPTFMHPGVGLFAASGDSGFQPADKVPFPAAATGIVSVGGTKLKKSSSQRGWDETVNSISGSGCSSITPKPAWQTDTGCSQKMTSDMSANSDNVASYCTDPGGGGGWSVVGGTSASSPFVAGVMAILGALDGGQFDPSWVWHNASSFLDITSGANGKCTGKPSYFCQSGVGFDGPTGVGVPFGPLLSGVLEPDAGVSIDAGVDAGEPPIDASVADGSAGPHPPGAPKDAGVLFDSGSPPSSATPTGGAASEDSGCACSQVGSANKRGGGALAVALFALAVVARKRRRGHRG